MCNHICRILGSGFKLYVIAELCEDETIIFHFLQNGPEVLWECTRDLLKTQTAVDERRVMFRFLQCLIEGQVSSWDFWDRLLLPLSSTAFGWYFVLFIRNAGYVVIVSVIVFRLPVSLRPSSIIWYWPWGSDAVLLVGCSNADLVILLHFTATVCQIFCNPLIFNCAYYSQWSP